MDLQEVLTNAANEPDPDDDIWVPLDEEPLAQGPQEEPVPSGKAGRMVFGNNCQWAVGGNGKFSPVGSTVTTVPAGVYQPFVIPGQMGLQHMPINSDGIYTLPDMATAQVLAEAETFWNNEHLYRKHQLLYKRGILLYGPPGSGKTVTVKLLMKELIRRDGIVILCQQTGVTASVVKALREIEPKRNIIIVFEDIDEIINYNGESHVLSLLDGEHNVDNVLNIATTNYPDRLGPRIINRPSRFDTRVKVGMPNAAARHAYLEKATAGELEPERLVKWAADTENMSIAHLRELVAAVYCLGQDYNDVLQRLKELGKPPADNDDGWAPRAGVGFGSKRKSANNSDSW